MCDREFHDYTVFFDNVPACSSGADIASFAGLGAGGGKIPFDGIIHVEKEVSARDVFQMCGSVVAADGGSGGIVPLQMLFDRIRAESAEGIG